MADADNQFTDSSKVAFPTRVRRWISLSHLPLHTSDRKALLRLLDVLMLNSSLLLIAWLRLGTPLSWETLLAQPSWFILLTLLWLLVSGVFDAYSLERASSVPESVLGIAKSALVTIFVYLLIPYITPPFLYSRLTIGLFVASALSFLSLGRVLYALVLARPLFRRRALIMGAGWAGRTIAQAIRKNAASEYQLVGYIDHNPARQEEGIEGVSVLDTSEDLISLVRASDIDEVILAITHPDEIRGDVLQVILDCQELGFQIVFASELYEQLTGMLPVKYIGYNLQALLPSDGFPRIRLYAGLKRSMDILISVVGLIVLGVLLPFVALAIYLDSPGPIFYRQQRVGKGGKMFGMSKLRSMMPNAEEKGKAVWAEKADPRVSRVGRILRATHIDELPQFISVLRGEMSVVGPRPERPGFVSELAKQIPFYQLRHSVRPGITGWAQIKQGYAGSLGDGLSKLQYDLYYIKHRSIYFELLILLKTFGTMLTFRGR